MARLFFALWPDEAARGALAAMSAGRLAQPDSSTISTAVSEAR